MKPHIIISAQEHPSIDLCINNVEQQGTATITKVKSNFNGTIDVKNVIKAIQPNTTLISIMMINNETGVRHVDTIAKLGKWLHKNRDDIILHSDCVQSFCKYETDLS